MSLKAKKQTLYVFRSRDGVREERTVWVNEIGFVYKLFWRKAKMVMTLILLAFELFYK